MSTYLRKRGRLTRAQAKALETLGPEVLVPVEGAAPLDLEKLFGRSAPVGLEIGFGTGTALLDWAEASADWNLLGIEVYEPGIGSLLKGMSARGVDNIRVISEDAAVVLETWIAPGALDEVTVHVEISPDATLSGGRAGDGPGAGGEVIQHRSGVACATVPENVCLVSH